MSKSKKQDQVFDSSNFWARKNWFLSSTVNYVCGNVMVTEGTYKPPQPQANGLPSKPSGWILIFGKIGEERPTESEAEMMKKLTEDTRLPSGLAISVNKWSDFVRAFARYYMHKESKSQAEVSLFFGFDGKDFAKDYKFEDVHGKQVEVNPQRNHDLVRRSMQRAAMIEKVLAKLPKPGLDDQSDDKYGKIEDIDIEALLVPTSSTGKKKKNDPKDDKSDQRKKKKKKEDDDDSTDDDDDDDDGMDEGEEGEEKDQGSDEGEEGEEGAASDGSATDEVAKADTKGNTLKKKKKPVAVVKPVKKPKVNEVRKVETQRMASQLLISLFSSRQKRSRKSNRLLLCNSSFENNRFGWSFLVCDVTVYSINDVFIFQ